MKRMKVLIGKRRVMVIATLAILVVAAAALVASSASFTATSANPGNFFTAGSIKIDNSLNDEAAGTENAILSMDGMKPGDHTSGTVSVENVGSLPGTFTLSKTRTAFVNNAAFDTVLQLQIMDGATELYNGPLSGNLNGASAAYVYATPWAPSTPHNYTFTVTWPSARGGSVPATPTDNQLMDASCTYTFTWSAQQ
jgi:hypothetical protein